MSQFKKTLISCFSIFGFITLCLLLFGDKEKFSMIGMCGLILPAGYFFTEILVVFFHSGREFGKTMLRASGILLLIGIGVCSLALLNINMH